jgi:hypothetical protein
MKKYLILALSLILIYSACSKKPTTVPGRKDNLRTGKWKIASGTVTVKLPDGRDTTLNYMNYIPLCHQDDYFVFNSDLYGAWFNGDIRCNVGDPDSIKFSWVLGNNNNTLSLYNSDHLFYALHDSIYPYRFDTVNFSPLELDTLYGVHDTVEGYDRVLVILDTIWEAHYDSLKSVANTDIFNAVITDFSQSSFTLHFTYYSWYHDTTNHHTGMNIYPGTPPDTVDLNPILKRDTFKYKVTYTNF